MIDEFERQLLDLAAVRLPGGGQADRERFAAEFASAEGGIDSAGRWVLLPWENKAVHLLDEEAYFEVITNRNRDKITRSEQQLLRTKKVGVMGLSLGAEAAITLAQEHRCGHTLLRGRKHHLCQGSHDRDRAECRHLGFR